MSQNNDNRGSGSDKNSDTSRLRDPENYQDKVEEDTFPASDPPSHSPLTGVGRTYGDTGAGGESDSEPNSKSKSGDVPADLKNNPKAQFLYGRRTEKKTHHFDRTSRRLERGNPDVGEVDLGTIEADRPAQPDDHDHFDTADDDDDSGSQREF
jgi:hypothetical protein